MLSDALFTFYAQKYTDMLFRIAFSYLKSPGDAEDVCQNVLLKLYRTGKDFESEAHVRHWLIRVAVNECKKALLSPWRHILPLESCARHFSFSNQESGELMDLVMSLPPKYRAALYLHYFEGLSTEEMARCLGIPRTTVLTHLRRGREALKKLILEVENHV